MHSYDEFGTYLQLTRYNWIIEYSTMEPKLLDTTLREGQQSLHPVKKNEGVVFTDDQQLKLVEKLVDFGIDYIELGAPVRSKTQERISRKIIKKTRDTGTKVFAHTRCLKEDIDVALDLGFDGLNLFFNSSKAINMTDSEIYEQVALQVSYARKMSVKKIVRFSFEDAFRTDIKKIASMLSEIEPYVDRVGLPDTAGAASPGMVAKNVRFIKHKFPKLEIECHFHNDAGLAVANALTAFSEGAGVIDTTMLGIGERTGIASLSGVVAALMLDKKIGNAIKKKYDLTLLKDLDGLVAEILGIDVPLNIPLTSKSAFVHVAGVHANGQKVNGNAYQHFNPMDFDVEPDLIWASSVAGKASILHRAEQLNIKMNKRTAKELADAVREIARSNGGVSYKEVDSMIISNSKKTIGGMSREQDLKEDIIQNSLNHPDLSRRNMYKVLRRHFELGSKIKNTILEVFSNRLDIGPRHFSNLTAHAFEYFFFSRILLFDKEYKDFDTEDWDRAFETIFNSRKNSELLIGLLKTKVTQTNKFARYLGPMILMKLFFGDGEIDIVDEGASLNLGILGLKAGKAFSKVKDNTRGEFVNGMVDVKVNLKHSYGVDLYSPEESTEWILVCNFYPKESDGAEKFKKEFESLKSASAGVEFVEGDIADLKNIWNSNAFTKPNVALASTVLYQLKPAKRKKVFESTKDILLNGGVYIVNDFIKISGTKITWGRKWFDKSPCYATILYVKKNDMFEGPYEFLRWGNARCSEVFEGRDFSKVIELSGHKL